MERSGDGGEADCVGSRCAEWRLVILDGELCACCLGALECLEKHTSRTQRVRSIFRPRSSGRTTPRVVARLGPVAGIKTHM